MITERRLQQLLAILSNGARGPWKVGRPTFKCTTKKHDHDHLIRGRTDCTWAQSGWDDDPHQISMDREYIHEDFLDMNEWEKGNQYIIKSGSLITGGLGWDDGSGHEDGGIYRSFNSVLIVEMRNAFPALLEEIWRLRKELRKKRRRRTK